MYSDDLGVMEQLSRGLSKEPHLALLQSVLAISHKYQLHRLQAWCEQQLCALLDASMACGVLCQAHLYEAKQLETACLNHISNNLKSIIVTPEYGLLSKEWPAVLLKIQLHSAGVPNSQANAAFEAQATESSAAKKRKRSEDDCGHN